MIVAKRYTLTEAYAFFGIKLRNFRTSWSGRNPDDGTVAVTLWQDEFRDYGKIFRPGDIEDPDARLGSIELMENLRWAIDHCDSMVRVVVAAAKDLTAKQRKQRLCFPHPTMRMRIVELRERERGVIFERVD